VYVSQMVGVVLLQFVWRDVQAVAGRAPDAVGHGAQEEQRRRLHGSQRISGLDGKICCTSEEGLAKKTDEHGRRFP
jgi:hypothetical protein